MLIKHGLVQSVQYDDNMGSALDYFCSRNDIWNPNCRITIKYKT